MRVVFVEDEPGDISVIRHLVESTRLAEVSLFKSYDPIIGDEGQITKTDLFVLDIQVGGEEESYKSCIKLLRKYRRPFIVFSTNSDRHRSPTHSESLGLTERYLALEHGCIRYFHKGSRGKREGQLDVAEEIIRFLHYAKV